MTILKEAVERIAKGVFVSEYRIYAKKIAGVRSEHEVNLEIFVEKDGNENQVLLIKVFFGTPIPENF